MEDYGTLGSLTSGKVDVSVFLAWDGTRAAARMDRNLQEKNCTYSLQGVHSMISVGCKRIVTAGSQAEYGPCVGKISEETPCHPNTEYGKAKLVFYLKTADLCKQFGVEYREPRFFSLYGPDDYDGTMLISMLRAMVSGDVCKLTEGIQMWDFLYIDDAIEALYRLCIADCPNGVYNFGSGDMRQLKDYVYEMAQITQTTSQLDFGAIPYPETGVVSLWPDISRLKNTLGWKPKVSFNMGINEILKRKNDVFSSFAP